jgi:predicted O-methyltransferase YrrM
MQDIIDRIVAHLSSKSLKLTEGSASAEELGFLVELLHSRPGIKRVGEIGFNAGISSYAFLQARRDAKVVSFDIADHDYVDEAKAFVDQAFSGRHELIKGDSRKALPKFARERPETKFDLIFIDGGHDYKIAKADLQNARLLAHERTLVFIDDLTPWVRWGRGPTKAWDEVLAAGAVRQEGLYKNGRPVTDYAGQEGDRIWAVGRFV